MKTALLLLLGGFLCGLHGAEGQETPDLIIMITRLLTKVQNLEVKVQSHQSEIQSLKNQIQTLETEDRSYQSQDQTHQSQDQTHQSQDQSHQSEVQSLKNQIQTLENSQAQLQGPRVAFFAGFYTDTEEGNYGPFDVATAIKYKKVLTNVGGAYSADTGRFTAPLKGLYVFSFVMFTNNNTFVTLMRNTEPLAYAYDKTTADMRDSSTGVAVVTLEAGHTVYVQLEPRRHFYSFHGLLNSFSGFLLFPM